MGKSLYIQRLADSLAGNLRRSRSDVLVTIPLHGPAVTHDIILEFFMEHLKNPTCCIYHIDIAPNVSSSPLYPYLFINVILTVINLDLMESGYHLVQFAHPSWSV